MINRVNQFLIIDSKELPLPDVLYLLYASRREVDLIVSAYPYLIGRIQPWESTDEDHNKCYGEQQTAHCFPAFR